MGKGTANGERIDIATNVKNESLAIFISLFLLPESTCGTKNRSKILQRKGTRSIISKLVPVRAGPSWKITKKYWWCRPSMLPLLAMRRCQKMHPSNIIIIPTEYFHIPVSKNRGQQPKRKRNEIKKKWGEQRRQWLAGFIFLFFFGIENDDKMKWNENKSEAKVSISVSGVYFSFFFPLYRKWRQF